MRLFKNNARLLRSYDPNKAAMVTWLTVVARSMTIDFLRKRRLPTVPLEEHVNEIEAPEPGDAEPGPLNLPPDLLSPRQELVLRMMFEKDMDVPEIARVLHVREQTVRSMKHKGIEKLRRYFGRGGGGP